MALEIAFKNVNVDLATVETEILWPQTESPICSQQKCNTSASFPLADHHSFPLADHHSALGLGRLEGKNVYKPASICTSWCHALLSREGL